MFMFNFSAYKMKKGGRERKRERKAYPKNSEMKDK